MRTRAQCSLTAAHGTIGFARVFEVSDGKHTHIQCESRTTNHTGSTMKSRRMSMTHLSRMSFDSSSGSSSDGIDEALIPFDQRLDARKHSNTSSSKSQQQQQQQRKRPTPSSTAATSTASNNNSVTLAKNLKKRRLEGDKNAPVEMSAKVRVGRMRATVAGSTASAAFRDPRFDDRCGTITRDVSRGSYYFVAELEQQEIESLQAQLERAAQQDDDDPNFVDDDQLAAMQHQLDLLTRRRKDRERSLRQSDQRAALFQSEAESVANGKRAFYHSRSAIRSAVLQAEYKDLKASNGVKKTILNRAKRSTARARKSMPRRRLES